jgi:TonB family protein
MIKSWTAAALLFPGLVYTQITPSDIVNYRTEKQSRVDISKADGRIFIPCPFGKPELNNAEAERLKKAQVITVEIIYTGFRRSARFNQTELNKNRLENLRILLPALFNDPGIDWKITEQTGAENYPEASTYFHGFRIDFRPLIDREEERKKEVDGLLEALREDKGSDYSKGDFRPRIKEKKRDSDPVAFYETGPSFGSNPCDLAADAQRHLVYPKTEGGKPISGRVEVQCTINKNGGVQDIRFLQSLGKAWDEAIKTYLNEMPLWNPAKTKNTSVNAYVTLIFLFNPETAPEEREGCQFIVLYSADRKKEAGYDQKKEAAVSTVLNRKTDWKNLAVVCDVTASMSPYIRDLMGWFRTNQNRIIHFSFFNDGDMTPDSQKQIGATGGIYPIGSISAEAVEKELERAMRAGYGGDIPENDVEALLEAEQQAPLAERLLWIADNYALPRDKELLSRIKKPLSIILCTRGESLNPEYLTLARKARASVHTLGGDLPDLTELKNGDRFTWQDREYKLQNDKFERVY